MKPARYVPDARAKGVPVNEALKKSLKRQLTRLRNKSDGLVNGQANNWGGISSVLNLTRENLLSTSLNIRCSYLA